MNIKSLLLGSAAALVAVSGARAADAVTMVEPEPVEYVRICDVYGAGYFYIPGSETCLKISGLVRFRAIAADKTLNRDLNNTGDDYASGFQTRGRVEFDAREETELGTLRGFVRFQATNIGSDPVGTSGNGVVLDQGYIQIGGLTVGKIDSMWANDDGGIGDGLYTDNDWSVGDIGNNRISYTYAASGFSASVSVEDDGSGDFVPDVIGKLAYTGAWGGAYIVGVYDEQSGNSLTTPYRTTYNGFVLDGSDGKDTEDSAFALKAAIELKNLTGPDSLLKIEGSYAFDPTVYTSDAGGYLNYGVGNYGSSSFSGGYGLASEYQIGAGYQQTFGKLTAYLSGVYGKTFDLTRFDSITGDFVSNNDGADYYGVAGNVGYQVTKNLSVLGEVSYRSVDLPSDEFKQTAGFLEIKRTF